MIYLGHLGLLLLIGYASFLFNCNRWVINTNAKIATTLLICLPIAGVYFLGWWALLTSLAGIILGMKAYWDIVVKKETIE